MKEKKIMFDLLKTQEGWVITWEGSRTPAFSEKITLLNTLAALVNDPHAVYKNLCGLYKRVAALPEDELPLTKEKIDESFIQETQKNITLGIEMFENLEKLEERPNGSYYSFTTSDQKVYACIITDEGKRYNVYSRQHAYRVLTEMVMVGVIDPIKVAKIRGTIQEDKKLPEVAPPRESIVIVISSDNPPTDTPFYFGPKAEA